MTDLINQFRTALAARNIIPPEHILADGLIHRCDAAGKGGKDDAAYLLHMDGIPAGGFENHRDGLGWQNWRADTGYALSPAEEAAHRERIAASRLEREADEAKRKQFAREKANLLWQEAQPCLRYGYLESKGLQSAHGARLHGGRLVIPLRDEAGIIHSVQFIDSKGDKLLLKDGRKAGCYFSIGKPNGVLCIVEGFATGASIHEATEYSVAIAFDAGNLSAVAQVMRTKFPDLKLILCADDDHATPGNPGLTKATMAARTVGGLLAVPEFGGERQSDETDFNDLHKRHGLEAVRRCIEAANSVTETKPVPEAESSPVYGDSMICAYGGGRFELSARGTFFIGIDKEGKEQPPRWICSHLSVVAMTRDAKSGAWGRLLEWHDDDGVRHQWAMPLELLQGDGLDVRKELARLGLSIAPSKSARDLLASYLQVWPVNARARCVERLGWHGAVYVTPTESVGQSDEIVVFQNAHAIEPSFAVCGTPEEWRDTVGRLAAGNSRLVFAISIAFAGALAELAVEDSGGFHLCGKSSSGKSTALKVSASVWGHPATYPRLWRATANGLEGLAALHNDGLLILDELSQIDPKEAGEAAYMLANGQGKARASRTGAARQAARWRLLFLSAGEESLTSLMARAGRKTNAGQEIRLADIDADAGAGMGAFEILHDCETPSALALSLKDAATKYHGAVGLAWLRCIVGGRQKLPDFIENGVRQFVAEFAPKAVSGQVERVARRFALVAVAGEMASHYGLTGWPANEAISAARKCFDAWLSAFGGAGNREDRAILAQVRGFFEAHGASRFEDALSTSEQRIPNRAGFFRVNDHGVREFLVLPEAFRRDVCNGFDLKAATAALIAAGWLAPGEGTRATQKPRIQGIGTTRCYVFTGRMWEDD